MFLSDIAEKHILGFNTVRQTEESALNFCRFNKIHIVEDGRVSYGKLKFHREYVFILINPKLEAAWRLWVLWHEIGHFILHAPETSNFSESMRRKKDSQANYIAAVSLIPLHLVKTKTFGELQDEFGYPMPLIKIRKDIFDTEKR